MSFVTIATFALIAQCGNPNALQITFSAPGGNQRTICDGDANDFNGTFGTPNGVIDFSTVTPGGAFTVRGQLRESVDTGTKRLILSLNPDDSLSYPGTFRNTSAAAGTFTVSVSSSTFGVVELTKLLLHYQGMAWDPTPGPLAIGSQSVTGMIGSSPLSVTGPAISDPNNGQMVPIGPYDASFPMARVSNVTRLTGTLLLPLGPGDQIQLPSSFDIEGEQVVPTGRLIVGMNSQRLAFTLGPGGGGEGLIIFDGGAGDLSPGGVVVVDNIIDFNTTVGGVFTATGHVIETVGLGSKSLTLREDPTNVFTGTFRNVSTVESSFTLDARSSFFPADCFGSQSLTYDGTASDPTSGTSAVRIPSHSVTTTSPYSIVVIGPSIDLPTGGTSSFGPLSNNASGLTNARFLAMTWNFRAGRGDQIQTPGTIQTTASPTSGCPADLPALSDIGMIAAVGVLLALFWLRGLTRSSSH